MDRSATWHPFRACNHDWLRGASDGTAVFGTDDWIVLEVEHSQSHPEGNVLKYWPWLEGNKRRLVLVHAIAPDARKRHGPRTDLTRWLGRRMERSLSSRFRYCRVDLGTESESMDLQVAREAIDVLRSTTELVIGG